MYQDIVVKLFRAYESDETVHPQHCPFIVALLQRWGDEPRCHLQASRSADRLHLPQPREISRKMSTNSEYAVITYAWLEIPF